MNRDDGEKLLNAAIIVILVGAVAFGFYYVWQRYAAADEQLDKWLAGESATAVTCSATSGTFDESARGSFHLHDRMMRTDWEQFGDGGNDRFHAVTDGTIMHVWSDADNIGTVFEIERYPQRDVLEEFELEQVKVLQCSPWWFPDDSIFKPPLRVDFR